MRRKWSNSLYYLPITADELTIEEMQCTDEGKDISSLDQDLKLLKEIDLTDETNMIRAEHLLDATAKLPVIEGFTYYEPSDLKGIHSEKPGYTLHYDFNLTEELLFDKVYGAWLGRCSGCMLGKPVECRQRWQIEKYLKTQERWPLEDYFSIDADMNLREECSLANDWTSASSGNIDRAIEDDDTNYTVIGLSVFKNHGPDFTPEDVGTFWLQNLPVFHTCTAERIAYRNLLNMIPPPQSASFRNVYREWIGAQIRADFFGYVNPGNPERAAEHAWRDACISHVKNGIYGEMWVAAMLAAAYTTDDVETIIYAGLGEIPSSSRLTESIEDVITRYHRGLSYEEMVDHIHTKWNEKNPHHWCHTISNAMVVATALLWGEKDFTRTIGYSVMPGFDTDCNGATVGSILGLVLGSRAIPQKWIAPLNDTLETGITGRHSVSISALAKETIELMSLDTMI